MPELPYYGACRDEMQEEEGRMPSFSAEEREGAADRQQPFVLRSLLTLCSLLSFLCFFQYIAIGVLLIVFPILDVDALKLWGEAGELVDAFDKGAEVVDRSFCPASPGWTHRMPGG